MAKVQGNKKLLTVKNIRVNNKTNLLKQLVNGQNLTRNDLARESHISLMTVKHIVDDLVEEGIVEEGNHDQLLAKKGIYHHFYQMANEWK